MGNRKNVHIGYERDEEGEYIYIFNCFDSEFDYSFKSKDKDRIIKTCKIVEKLGYKISVCVNGIGLCVSDMLKNNDIKHKKLKHKPITIID